MGNLSQKDDTVEVAGGGLTRWQSLAILATSLIAAVTSLLGTVIAQRLLPGEDITDFMIFWSAIFAVYGVVSGVQQEVTRAVGTYRMNAVSDEGATQGVHVVPMAGLVGIAVAVLLAATAFLWAPATFSRDVTGTVALLSIGAALYAMHSAYNGASAGREKWYLYSAIGSFECIWRLIAMAVAGTVIGTSFSLKVAVVSTVLMWFLFVVFSKEGRKNATARADIPAKPFLRNVIIAVLSSAASAVLMTGFPVFVKASESSSDDAETLAAVGVLTLAISLTRSPIMIPLQGFQSVAVSLFLQNRDAPLKALNKPLLGLLGVGAIGGVLAWAIGPFLFSFIYPAKTGQEEIYAAISSGPVLALLTFASAVMALLVLSGTMVLAANNHRTYILGWISAATVSVFVIFFVPLDVIPRTVLALYVGPLVGFFVNLVGLMIAAKR